MRNSTIGYTNAVVPVTGNYTFSEEDAIASIQAGFVSGSTITLPGPSSGHNPPNNGDTYVIADPQNQLNAGAKTVTVNGGGYEFLGEVGGVVGLHSSASFGSLLFVASTASGNNALKTGVAFTFDATAEVWIVN
jgi:hypothetical protein